MGCVGSKSRDAGATLAHKNRGSERSVISSAGSESSAGTHQTLNEQSGQPARELSAANAAAIDSFFATNQFFSKLTSSARKTAKLNLLPVVCTKGQLLVEKLAPVDDLYLVVRGCVTVCRRATVPGEAPPDDNVVQEHFRNDAVGVVEFFFQTRSPHALISASDDTLLLKMPRRAYKQNRKAGWLKFFANYVVLSARQFVQEHIKDTDLTSGIAEEHLEKLGKLFKVKVFARGEAVIREGDLDDRFFAVASGELAVTVNGKAGGLALVKLKVLRRGDAFGETSLLKRKPRLATITALEESTLLELTRESLERFQLMELDAHRVIVTRLRNRLEIQSLAKLIPFTKGLNPNTLKRLSTLTIPMAFRPGTPILTQGRRHPAMFYILQEGSVDIFLRKAKIKSLDNKGAYFGELSIVSNRAHSATVRAGSGGAKCLACSKADFRSVFRDEVALFAEVAIKVLGKEVELRHILNHPMARQVMGKFLAKEFAQENLNFLVGAEEIFRMGEQVVERDILEALGFDVDEVVSARYKELVSKCKEIYDCFIRDGSSQQINLPGHLRNEITEQVEAGDFSYDMFAKLRESIYTLVERDSFPRFQRSKAFETFLEKLGVYNDSRGSILTEVDHRSYRRRPSARRSDASQLPAQTVGDNARTYSIRIRQQIVDLAQDELEEAA